MEISAVMIDSLVGYSTRLEEILNISNKRFRILFAQFRHWRDKKAVPHCMHVSVPPEVFCVGKSYSTTLFLFQLGFLPSRYITKGGQHQRRYCGTQLHDSVLLLTSQTLSVSETHHSTTPR
jgi:hypothetical protein